ncbi:MAG: DUF445 family protein, partial [Veillonella sp.]|nr:DUF445 family protein [Veillonella sp.]
MMKTKPVATTLLVVMAIIFLISYPQRHDTFWAFIMHISGAAMIGGLADWYAVTALFTKPLGIPFKTAILPRSKERLIQIGRTMLSEELLRVPQMYYAIKKERVMVRIVEYGMSDVGQVQIRNLLYGVGNQVLSHMDIEPMRQEINKAIYKGVTNWKATDIVADKERGVLMNASQIKPIEFNGNYFQVRGPISTPQSPQRRPVNMQAGASKQGIALAAR